MKLNCNVDMISEIRDLMIILKTRKQAEQEDQIVHGLPEGQPFSELAFDTS